MVVAGAVVTKDVPDYTLVAGVPAKQIGQVNEYGEVIRMSKICVISSAHSVDDTRIYLKQIISLKNAGYNIVFLNKDKEGTNDQGVEFRKIELAKNRLSRHLLWPFKMHRSAKEQKADVYHFHDHQLLTTGLLLRISGEKVIYDAHEDVPRQVINAYGSKSIKGRILATYFDVLQRLVTPLFSMNIVATPKIGDVFTRYRSKSICIKNYTKLDEFIEISDSEKVEKSGVCYLGGISKHRGIYEMIEAVKLAETVLNLGGSFMGNLKEESFKQDDWIKHVNYCGFVNREKVARMMRTSVAGLVVLHPTSQYLESLPIKMFEYMAAGIPVIASRFPLWEEIIEGGECGVCVNPLMPDEISSAINYLVSNPEIAKQMGRNGKRLIKEKYNWKIEEEKLLELYRDILT